MSALIRGSTDRDRHPSASPGAAARAAVLAVAILAGAAPAASPDTETQRLMVEAVEAASDLDLYNARCRRDQSGRATDNLNKAMVGKLRITVLSVLDDLFPERSYRRAQQRLETDFLNRLRDLGGCQAVKESALPEALSARYREKLDAVRALP
jgi:hypothetical protein